MNNKGFTLIELLATIIVLSIIAGITFSIVRGDLGKAKKHVEEVFVETIRDSLNVYLNSDAKNLSFSDTGCKISKKHSSSVSVETANVTMYDVINSSYSPISISDLAKIKDIPCSNPLLIPVSIYRDSDYVYYYSVDKTAFGCLKNIGGDYETVISNLPEGYTCS